MNWIFHRIEEKIDLQSYYYIFIINIIMENNIIKLNARGTIMYVDYMILTKSTYFDNMISGLMN